MRKKHIRAVKSQSILEYLAVLTAVIVVIVAHTFAHFPNIRPGQMVPHQGGPDPLGVNRALDEVHEELNETIHQDFSGTPVDIWFLQLWQLWQAICISQSMPGCIT